MASLISSIESLTLALPPSCIEFCPAHSEYFLVGTYNLELDDERACGDTSKPQQRNGSILVFKLKDRTMRHLQTIPQPSAVLDLHFQTIHNRQDVVAVVSSTATLSIYRLSPSQETADILKDLSVVRIPGVGEDVLFLFCSWHPVLPDVIAVSTSTGAVYVICLQQLADTGVTSAAPVLLHDLEAWTVVFSPMLELAGSQDIEELGDSVEPKGKSPVDKTASGKFVTTLYSGGDDSTLRYTPCVFEKKVVNYNSPLLTPSVVCTPNGHGAGVTAILPLSLVTGDGGQLVITGSYDDFIRVYSIHPSPDTEKACQARCLAAQNLGGGVWRLKLIRQILGDSGFWKLSVLASCMHAGVRVVHIHGVNHDVHISVAACFEEHESMNYGSDFCIGSPLLCVSTSFYDKRMCLWETDD